MAYIIDENYFNIELQVPNTTEMNSGSLVELDYFIDKYSRLLMLNFLGYELYNELNGYLVNGLLPDVPTLPDPDPVPLKWRNLVTGCEYVVNDKTVKWKGLIFTEGTAKQSILANFVYYHWLKESVSFQSGVGEVKGLAKNAISVNSTQSLVNVWNDFVEMYQGCGYGNSVFNTVYYIGNVYDYYGFGNGNPFISLLGFLNDNREDYESANIVPFELQNQLGL